MNLQDISNSCQHILKSGATARDLCVVAVNIQRREMEKRLFSHFDGLIQDGIFKGVRISDTPHDSVLIPKILGTYETEIADHIRNLAEQCDIFIDIGCADGYYTSGIATNTNVKKVVGVDISSKALDLATVSAHKNKVGHKCIFKKELADALPYIESGSFIMIDVDGEEQQVLNELSEYIEIHQLRKIKILIETDFKENGRSNQQEIIDQINKMGFKIKETIAFDPLHPSRFTSMAKQLCPSYIDQMICALERGNANQSWIIAHID